MNALILLLMIAMSMQVALISLVAMCVIVNQVMKEMEHSVKVRLKYLHLLYFYHITYLSDVDECENDTLNNCDNNADCFDTEGSFTCTCREGYNGTGFECQGK